MAASSARHLGGGATQTEGREPAWKRAVDIRGPKWCNVVSATAEIVYAGKDGAGCCGEGVRVRD